MSGSMSHDLHQFLVRQMVRTGTADQQPLWREQVRGQSVQLIVGLESGLVIPFPLDEGRRIEHHDFKSASGFLQLPKSVKGIVRHGFDFNLIEGRISFDQVNRRGRGVETSDLARTRSSRGNPPSSGVAESIQDFGTGYITPQTVKDCSNSSLKDSIPAVVNWTVR